MVEIIHGSYMTIQNNNFFSILFLLSFSFFAYRSNIGKTIKYF